MNITEAMQLMHQKYRDERLHVEVARESWNTLGLMERTLFLSYGLDVPVTDTNNIFLRFGWEACKESKKKDYIPSIDRLAEKRINLDGDDVSAPYKIALHKNLYSYPSLYLRKPTLEDIEGRLACSPWMELTSEEIEANDWVIVKETKFLDNGKPESSK